MTTATLVIHVTLKDYVNELNHLYEMAQGLGYKAPAYFDRGSTGLESTKKKIVVSQMLADIANGTLKVVKA